MREGWSPRLLVAAAVALVFGLVIGGLGPRSEVRALRAQVDDLQARPCRGGTEVTSLFRGRIWEGAGDEAPEHDVPPDIPVTPPDPAPAPSEDRSTAEPVDVPPPPPSLDDESAERIKDGLEIRRTQALAALRERAGASSEQMADVDGIVDRMNQDLAAVAETWVATASEGDLGRRDMMLLASETLDVLIETEDALYETFSPDQRAALDDEVLDPTAYVDGSVVDRFAALEPQ